MAVQKARYENRSSPLASEFGEAMARRWFEPDILKSWPRLKSGKNKGKLTGFISWRKVTEEGWCYSEQKVLYPGTADVELFRTEKISGMTREFRLKSKGKVS